MWELWYFLCCLFYVNLASTLQNNFLQNKKLFFLKMSVFSSNRRVPNFGENDRFFQNFLNIFAVYWVTVQEGIAHLFRDVLYFSMFETHKSSAIFRVYFKRWRKYLFYGVHFIKNRCKTFLFWTLNESRKYAREQLFGYIHWFLVKWEYLFRK